MNFLYQNENIHTKDGQNKGEKGYLVKEDSNITFSVAVSFSQDAIYGCLVTKETFNSHAMKFFYFNTLKARRITGLNHDKILILVGDNSKTHKSKEILKYIDEAKIRLFTIVPYSP